MGAPIIGRSDELGQLRAALLDPVRCYGLPDYLRIIGTPATSGWPR